VLLCTIVAVDAPKLVIHPFVTRHVSVGQDGQIFLLFHDSYRRPIGQILSLHVKKERPNWPFTPLHNSKNTKLMQILIGLLERAHENPGTESQLSTLLLSISKTKLITTFGRFSHTFLSRILNDFIKGVRSFQPNQQRGP